MKYTGKGLANKSWLVPIRRKKLLDGARLSLLPLGTSHGNLALPLIGIMHAIGGSTKDGNGCILAPACPTVYTQITTEA